MTSESYTDRQSFEDSWTELPVHSSVCFFPAAKFRDQFTLGLVLLLMEKGTTAGIGALNEGCI